MALSAKAIRLCLLISAPLAAGCGYQQSGRVGEVAGGYQWSSLYRQDVRTVAIPIFQNRDFRRGVEFRLTEAVAKQLEAFSPYKVVPRSRADTILEGEITEVHLRTLGRDFQTNLPREQVMTVTLDFVWKDLRSGQILVQRRGFQQNAMFYPTLGEGEFTGSQLLLERLALAIVQELQADW